MHDYTITILTGAVGVTLSLHGYAVANNSYVNVADIGNTNDSALLCCTDKLGCCGNKSNKQGHWYFPNRVMVPYTIKRGLQRNRGDGVVRLKQNGTSTDRGLFYCKVPDANNENQTVYVYIGNARIIHKSNVDYKRLHFHFSGYHTSYDHWLSFSCLYTDHGRNRLYFELFG